MPALLLFMLATSVTVPLVAMGSGPTYDTLGTMDAGSEEASPSDDDAPAEGEEMPVIEVEGREVDEYGGELRMTTVAVRNRITLVNAVSSWIDADQTLVPRDQVFPPTRSEEEVSEANRVAMLSSEHSAEAAAYRYLDIPMEPVVADVVEGAAADGLLEPEDVVVAVDGEATATSEDVAGAIGGNAPGDEVAIDLVRAGEERTVTVPLEAGPDGSDPQRGVAGISIGDVPTDGTRVGINMDPAIGGPSAGMMFALGIIDKLSPDVLSGGETVAGSGTVNTDGEVGPIGGIRHKITAAREEGTSLFLVPAGNCGDAATVDAGDLTIAAVDNLSDAVEAVRTHADGGVPQGCE